MVRRTSTINFDRIKHIQDKIEVVQGDLLDQMSLIGILQEYRPTEVYNLAAELRPDELHPARCSPASSPRWA